MYGVTNRPMGGWRNDFANGDEQTRKCVCRKNRMTKEPVTARPPSDQYHQNVNSGGAPRQVTCQDGGYRRARGEQVVWSSFDCARWIALCKYGPVPKDVQNVCGRPRDILGWHRQAVSLGDRAECRQIPLLQFWCFQGAHLYQVDGRCQNQCLLQRLRQTCQKRTWREYCYVLVRIHDF